MLSRCWMVTLLGCCAGGYASASPSTAAGGVMTKEGNSGQRGLIMIFRVARLTTIFLFTTEICTLITAHRVFMNFNSYTSAGIFSKCCPGWTLIATTIFIVLINNICHDCKFYLKLIYLSNWRAKEISHLSQRLRPVGDWGREHRQQSAKTMGQSRALITIFKLKTQKEYLWPF